MSVTSQSDPLSRLRSKQLFDLLAAGKRIDGRNLPDYRELKIERNVIDKADGSAMTTLGKTKVLVGIKVQTGPPYPDTPNSAVLTVNAEFLPLAHEFFEPGPPNENAIGLARIIDRGIRESKAIDLDQLVIIPGKTVYVIFIDIYILNHDGNLVDASGYAALTALASTKINKHVVDENGSLKKTSEKTPLPIREYPIPCTTVKIGDKLVADPNLEEERIASAFLTITTTMKNNICALQKNGSGVFTKEEILQSRENSSVWGAQIRKQLDVGGMNNDPN